MKWGNFGGRLRYLTYTILFRDMQPGLWFRKPLRLELRSMRLQPTLLRSSIVMASVCQRRSAVNEAQTAKIFWLELDYPAKLLRNFHCRFLSFLNGLQTDAYYQ